MNAAIAQPTAALASRAGGIAASAKPLRRASAVRAPVRARAVVKAAASEVRLPANPSTRERPNASGIGPRLASRDGVAARLRRRRGTPVFFHPHRHRTLVSRARDVAARSPSPPRARDVPSPR